MHGDASVGTDTITGGVNRVRGSNFNDTILGDANNNILEGQGGRSQFIGQDSLAPYEVLIILKTLGGGARERGAAAYCIGGRRSLAVG